MTGKPKIAWISLLVVTVLGLTVVPAIAAPLAPRGTFNNNTVARCSAANTQASMMATARANSANPTPAEQILSRSQANANSVEVETTRQLNQQQAAGAVAP
jgi:hypothetical protein